MASSAEEKAFKAAMALTDDERRRLCDRIEATLDEGSEEEIAAAWHQEALRRAAELRSGKVKALPWTEVEASLRSRLAKRRSQK